MGGKRQTRARLTVCPLPLTLALDLRCVLKRENRERERSGERVESEFVCGHCNGCFLLTNTNGTKDRTPGTSALYLRSTMLYCTECIHGSTKVGTVGTYCMLHTAMST